MSIEILIERAKEGDREALEKLLASIQDDIYRLALRMLGLRAEAEDATQEILIKVLTHLSDFRGESAFRTWVWRIAVRHVLASKRAPREEVASWETLEMLIERGEARPPQPDLPEQELAVLTEEVRLSCTQGMLMSLDREQRMSYVLAEIFDLAGEEAADVLEIEPAAHRKRLSRARERLGAWMGKHCGLVRPENACRCARQVPVAMDFGVVSVHKLQYAGHPAARRHLPVVAEALELEAAARELGARHPSYVAPPALIEKLRAMIATGRYQLLS